ncbi:hypothetical protein [Streptomyces sp. NPDC101393]|uniref:hypothetical protein n=1 Tax=Streptomyces sp. NPDC101393 TaxID=3366141 RepID=UPI00382FEFDD
MSSAMMTPATAHPPSLHPVRGATALGPDPARGAQHAHANRHWVGNSLRAVKVFVTSAFSVVILGEYADG